MVAYNSDQFGADKTVPGAGLNNATLFGSFNVQTALAPADTINFFTAPKGFTYITGFLYGLDLDSNATETLDIDIGIATDPDFFGNLGVITGDAIAGIKPEASIWMPLGGNSRVIAPTAFTEDTDVIATVNAAAATAAAGRIAVVMFGVINDSRSA